MASESDAEQLIAAAKRKRQARLKQAKDQAEDDLKQFRAAQEKKFEQDYGAKANADPSAELSTDTRAEAEAVQRDYRNNKDKTISFIVSKVLDVPMTLTDTQKQVLKM